MPPETQTPNAVPIPHPTLSESQSFDIDHQYTLWNEKVSIRLTPLGKGTTPGFIERTTWQSTPAPNIISIATPRNSATGSRRTSLVSLNSILCYGSVKAKGIPISAPAIRVVGNLCAMIACGVTIMVFLVKSRLFSSGVAGRTPIGSISRIWKRHGDRG